MFSRKFKKHGLLKIHIVCVYIIFIYWISSLGVLHLSTYLQVYKVGDIVDVKVNIIGILINQQLF